jgi:exopolyphosphatase / guanosine-5'-triphosphate,3'-diphosphate pyrophosphatase
MSGHPHSIPVNRAVIDVGTNSVKLLIAEVHARVVTPHWEEAEQTRLGQGFYETHLLQPEAISQTARVVAKFAARAAEWKCETLRVIATSAARDAGNQCELVKAIRLASGVPVEILSGEQEAEWVFQGVMTDPAWAEDAALIVDLGGGSTECIVGDGPQHLFRHSFRLGSVRSLERRPVSDPPTANDWLLCRQDLHTFVTEEMRPVLDPVLSSVRSKGRLQLIGTGGATSILARMKYQLDIFDREKINASVLTREELRLERERLWGMPLDERRKLAGLPPNRADVILIGAAVFETLLEVFGFDEMRVSTRGLRYAALINPVV